MNICVFCSSSDAVSRSYFDAAEELGRELAVRKHTLIFGGGKVGLMGALAKAVHSAGGKVFGVMPRKMAEWNVGYEASDEMILTKTMRERKAVMEEMADAFIALPGGLGTFEELLEITTLKQLHFHSKPIVILNIHGYYDPLLALMGHAVQGRFMKPETLSLYKVCNFAAEAINYIETYEAPKSIPKFFVELLPENDADAALE